MLAQKTIVYVCSGHKLPIRIFASVSAASKFLLSDDGASYERAIIGTEVE